MTVTFIRTFLFVVGMVFMVAVVDPIFCLGLAMMLLGVTLRVNSN